MWKHSCSTSTFLSVAYYEVYLWLVSLCWGKIQMLQYQCLFFFLKAQCELMSSFSLPTKLGVPQLQSYSLCLCHFMDPCSCDMWFNTFQKIGACYKKSIRIFKKKKGAKMTGKLVACHVYWSGNCHLKTRPAGRQANVWDVIHNEHTWASDLTSKESRPCVVSGQEKNK